MGFSERFAIPSLKHTPSLIWYSKGNRIKLGSDETGKVNEVLNSVNKTIAEVFTQIENELTVLNGILYYKSTMCPYSPKKTLNLIKESVLKPETAFDSIHFLYQTYSDFIEERICNAERDGIPLAEATIKQYRITSNRIKEYEELYGKINLKMLSTDGKSDFIRSFSTFLTEVKRYKPNSKGKLLKQFNTFILELSGTKKLPYTLKKFRCGNVDKDSKPKVALTLDELNILFNMKGLSIKLENVRKMFLIACWTGLRFSDWSTIQQYKGSQTVNLKVTAQKNKSVCMIPIVDQIRPYLEYFKNEGMPSYLTNNNYNAKVNGWIKEIMKRAGLDRKVTLDGVNYVPLHTVISSHVARATLITNLYKENHKLQDIIRITGHKSVEQLDPYIRISTEELTETIRRTSNLPQLNPEWEEVVCEKSKKSPHEILAEAAAFQHLSIESKTQKTLTTHTLLSLQLHR
jgi:site-specific recombinase XerD